MNLLEEYYKKQQQISSIQEEIKEQLDKISALQTESENLKILLREEVEEKGEQEGYGYKAYLQVRKSITYVPDKIQAKFPKIYELVTEVVVNKEKIAGLIKGKILTEEQLLDCQEVKETQAFYLQEVKGAL